ncbi:MAG: glycosyl hydrolase family 18 protein [Bacteroidota bacterium]
MKRKKIILSVFICAFVNFIFAQSEYKSILQEQSEEYSKYNFTTAQQWDSLFLAQNPGMTRKILPKERNNCTLDKVVYGWNPYWAGSTYLNYQWNLLSHLSHFSYEVDYADGTANSTHNWATDDAVDSALANGVKVDLCVTLFSNHATFLTNSTSKQTLITNLISLVQSRGANGVNIDFEGVPGTQAANFTNFMIDLCDQMHTSVPGSQVSIALYSEDWNDVFNEPVLNSYVDLFIIMGYAYYYGGSSQAGPTDPLYNFVTSYNYTLTRSVTYYLNEGISSSKLILGLPYYGYEWATVDNAVPSSTTATGSSKTYRVVMNNANGYYTNKLWNEASYTPYYAFQNSSWYQCWIDDAYSMGERFDMVNQRGIGGMGIWALGYDDGYTDFWDKITDKFSSCATVNCIDTIYDMGGPLRNYYNNENYTYAIQPSGASAVSLAFGSFSVADDTLWLYDGPDISSPIIGSYTSTNSPGTITSSGDALTLKFRSRASTNSTGWDAVWSCITDNIAPTTLVSVSGNWQIQDFTANFNDSDNTGGSGIEKRFYDVCDFNGAEWDANAQNGFFMDDFNSLNTSVWTVPASSGTWQANGGNLLQTDSTVSNTNIYAALNQNLSEIYLYHFIARIENAVYSTNQRRFGFHFFCDDASQTNRGNSYFIYFRQETSKLEFYKVANNTYTQTKVVDNVTTVPCQWYDLKIIYNKTTGTIDVYRDNTLIGSWTDDTPYSSNGDYISFRTGNCNATINDIKVYRSRSASALVSVGNAATNDIRYENINPSTIAAQIFSIVTDGVGLISTIDSQQVNIDWTPPIAINEVNDGTYADIDTTSIITFISANFSKSSDPNSGIDHYQYCFGTTPGGDELIGWTNNGTDTSVTRSGFTLQNGSTYYFSVFAVNGAGLASDTVTSDGVYILYAPVAGFTTAGQVFCTGDTVFFTNTSTNATSYLWNFPGGNPASSTLMNPMVVYDTIGTYDVTLYAYGPGGTDTIEMIAYIFINPAPQADFSVIDTLVYLPSADVVFINSSSDASSFLWDFGDGTTSADENPWHTYDTVGVYSIMLIASNALCGNDTLVLADYIYVESDVGINEIENIYSASLQPVPVNENSILQIFIVNTDVLKIDLLDVSGKIITGISESNLNKGTHKFIISREKLNIKSGTYLLRISGNKGNQYLKFVVQ